MIGMLLANAQEDVSYMLRNKSRIYAISAKISKSELELAKAYIKGAVHCFTKNKPNENFSVQILFGGVNKDWNGSPLQAFYDYYAAKECTDAEDRAAQDVGKLLKSVLDEDIRHCYIEEQRFTKEYAKL